MTLKDCTKDELIFVIERLQFYGLTAGDFYIRRALCDVEDKRERRKYEEIERLSGVMSKKAREIDQLYLPYDDNPYCQIPDDVVAKAEIIAREYDKARLKWYKLMGIKTKK